MRDISISRAKPATRLTIVSPPIVPVALIRFMGLCLPRPRLWGSAFVRGLRLGFRRGGLAFPRTLLPRLELRDIGRGEVDRIEQQRREASVGDGIGDDLPREREQQPR